MKMFLKIQIFLLFIACSLSGQNTFSYDITRFFYNGNISRVEVHYSIPYNMLSYTSEDGKMLAPIRVDVRFENMLSGEALSDTMSLVSEIESDEAARKRHLQAVEQFDAYFKPGNYKMEISVIDRNTGKKTVREEIFAVDKLKEGLSISDIELATSIEQDTTSGLFTKNGLRIIPNPSAVYGNGREMLYFYVEVYNLNMDTIPYHVSYSIVDKGGNAMNKVDPQERRKEKESNVGIEVGGLNIVTLKPGYYTLLISVKDGENTITGERNFQVHRIDFEENEQKNYFTDEEMKYYDRIEYIASERELKEYKALSDTGKAEFLKRFWLRRDPNKAIPENEAIQQFIKRINYVEDKFRTPFKTGYQTDRGRIYIKYGPPDAVQRNYFEIDYDPYEIWEYFSYGGYKFIFSDISGDGEFALIFSSTSKEPSFSNWRKYVPENEGAMQGE